MHDMLKEAIFFSYLIKINKCAPYRLSKAKMGVKSVIKEKSWKVPIEGKTSPGAFFMMVVWICDVISAVEFGDFHMLLLCHLLASQTNHPL